MMQTPFPADRSYIPQSLPGAEIASYPIIHQGATDATYVACDPLHRDVVLAEYAKLGWDVEGITDEDYQNMQARRAMNLLLQAWSAAEASGNAALERRFRAFHWDLDHNHGAAIG